MAGEEPNSGRIKITFPPKQIGNGSIEKNFPGIR